MLISTSLFQKSTLQAVRNYNLGNEILGTKELKALNKAIVLEGLSFAEDSNNSFYLINAQINCASASLQLEDIDDAQYWLNLAKTNVENKTVSNIKDLFLAKLFYQLGNLERIKGDKQKAANNYKSSFTLLTDSLITLKYEASKSFLITLQEIGNKENEVEKYLADVIDYLEENRKEIQTEQERNSFFDNEQTVYDIAIEHEVRKGNNKKAIHYAEISSSRSLLDRLNKEDNVSSTPLKIDEIQKRMPKNVQILQYSILKERVLIWSITKNNLILRESKINSKELKKIVSKYVDNIKTDDKADSFETKKLAKKLFNILIKPIANVLDSSKEICIVPSKFLFNLPFASLILPDGKFLISQFTIFYSPSLNVFIVSTKKAKSKEYIADESLLGIGNADFDKKEYIDLQDLPFANTEVKNISEYYTVKKILFDEKATKTDFKQLYKNFTIIHFAGHYLVKSGQPSSSGLLFAKSSNKKDTGIITNAELIAEQFPKTKLIVLSACQTGVEGYYDGEGLIGLSRTFLAAGIPIVVGSQWKVDSEATSELMTNFHRHHRQNGVTINEALRLAQLEMLNSSTKKNRSPYYWAAFSVLGGYLQ